MAGVVYLDPEDEITSAAARIRNARESRVALVLPFGSRLATSRINFRLLSREARINGRRLDIVAPDASARALAASAGLSVFASVGEWEAAIQRGDAGPDADATGEASTIAGATSGRAVARRGGTGFAAGGDAAVGPGDDAGDDAGDDTTAPSDRRAGASPRVVHASRRLRVPRAAAAGIALLAFAAFLGGVALWLLLPSAEIVVTPRLVTIGPIELIVRADPAADAVDIEAAVIPATTITIPVRVQGAFASTGTRVEQTAASGTVTFESINTVGPVAVPEGTRVATLDGVVFHTTARVVVPQAQVAGERIERGRADVGVRADRPGTQGNVAAGAITQVPASLQTQQVAVSNAAATTGGTATTFPKITQADVDAALAQLAEELRAQFDAALADPVGVPAGATLFPDTAVLGAAQTDVDPATLVGQEVAQFAIQMAADGTVQAVDEAPLQSIAEARLSGSVSEGHELVEGSSVVIVGAASVRDGVITFPVAGYAHQLRPVRAEDLLPLVLGRSREAAAEALAPYGDVELVLWPDWVSTVPTLEQRVSVTVGTPRGEPLPTPPPSPTAPPSAEPSGDAPSAEPVPSPS